MYWLLDYETQERVRHIIIRLQEALGGTHKRNQFEQQFPFNGRKDRTIARTIIAILTNALGTVCDPFVGSGTFGYAALDEGRETFVNEWEPFAFRLGTAPYRGLPASEAFELALSRFDEIAHPRLFEIYKTRCPECGTELMFDGLFFDRQPAEFFTPTPHERLGSNGENVIFRTPRYRCQCGCKEKRFDTFDESVLRQIDTTTNFPDVTLIENSRLNFTAPDFILYRNLFSPRQQKALMIIWEALQKIEPTCYDFFIDAFLSIIHLGKYVDYRSKSQDNHCPENRLKETNLYYRFIETLQHRKEYIENQHFNTTLLHLCNQDFRVFLDGLQENSIDLLLTDPPYGDSAQYFEHAQRVHPFMGYQLAEDNERLLHEVVISNSPARPAKHGKEQFLDDIETLFTKAQRIVSEHGYFVMYFRPEQGDWISDLNKLKHFGRKHGFEPLITIPLDNNDPSMRVLASAAWSFSKDICFVFLKLRPNECRWYDGDTDVDELVYLAALAASNNQGEPFVFQRFAQELRAKFNANNLRRLTANQFQPKILETIERFCIHEGAQYRLSGSSPYIQFNSDMNAEQRLREFVPCVIEELTADRRGFTFEQYVIHLASYMENGTRRIIQDLHSANRLVPELLLRYAIENREQGLFFARTMATTPPRDGQISIREMEPADFEHLIADYFLKRGFIHTEVIGQSCDRGVDVLATNANGELELIQCKRYRTGNNIGSAPIQRVDSYKRSRNAHRAWVITTSDFTPEGIDEARITDVVIVNGNNLIESLNLYYPGQYTL